jgi:small multidrug resistance pump
MSISYAVWSGVGIVLITLIGFVVYRQRLDLPALIGLGLILAGVLVIHLFSRSVAH